MEILLEKCKKKNWKIFYKQWKLGTAIMRNSLEVPQKNGK
jgi:hypothetical protein